MPRNGGAGGGTISFLHGLSFSLFLQAKINPTIWDVIPQVPRYSRGTLDVIAAQIIKAVAFSIENIAFKEQLNKLGAALYSTGTKIMDYDDDWFCGNSPIPVPPHAGLFEFLNFPEAEINPQPQPPKNYYGGILSIVAESINHKAIATSLKNIAINLMQQG